MQPDRPRPLLPAGVRGRRHRGLAPQHGGGDGSGPAARRRHPAPRHRQRSGPHAGLRLRQRQLGDRLGVYGQARYKLHHLLY